MITPTCSSFSLWGRKAPHGDWNAARRWESRVNSSEGRCPCGQRRYPSLVRVCGPSLRRSSKDGSVKGSGQTGPPSDRNGASGLGRSREPAKGVSFDEKKSLGGRLAGFSHDNDGFFSVRGLGGRSARERRIRSDGQPRFQDQGNGFSLIGYGDEPGVSAKLSLSLSLAIFSGT